MHGIWNSNVFQRIAHIWIMFFHHQLFNGSLIWFWFFSLSLFSHFLSLCVSICFSISNTRHKYFGLLFHSGLFFPIKIRRLSHVSHLSLNHIGGFVFGFFFYSLSLVSFENWLNSKAVSTFDIRFLKWVD